MIHNIDLDQVKAKEYFCTHKYNLNKIPVIIDNIAKDFGKLLYVRSNLKFVNSTD